MVKQNLSESHGDTPPSRRAIQAQQTRTEIIGAARRLFAAQGYASTSVKDIAREAGVSVQTLYDSVGSKADLVRRLNDLIDTEARVFEIAMTLPMETDPAVVARVPARITRRIVERCSDILRTGVDAARTEPDLAFVIEEGGRRHRAVSRVVAERLAALGALGPSRSIDEAATAIAALADFRLALILIDDHGFDFDAVEHWVADMTVRAVLDRGVIDA
jgi:AcrR family transcriptional regulator